MIIRVAIVEDDAEAQKALKAIITSDEDIICEDLFEDAESFASRFMDLNVDVVLMDINLPGNSGIQTVAKLKPRRPEVQFMMCTVFDDAENIFASLCLGATGYILKSEAPNEIINAIKEIKHGGSPMSAQIARRVVESFQQRKSNALEIDQLNTREWEILSLLDKGFRYKEISSQLTLSFETVRTYVRNIYDKLQVHNQSKAVAKALKNRIVK